MVVESASRIGFQSELRIVDLHHRERLARSAVLADDGKVSDSDQFLRVSHAAPASDLEGWRWPDTSVECPGQPRVDRWLRHPIRADSTSHTPSRSGPRPALIAPITVASWLELPIPQLWRPAGDVVLDCAEHLDVDLRTSTPRAMSQRPAEHRFEAHDARRGDVAGEGSVRPRG